MIRIRIPRQRVLRRRRLLGKEIRLPSRRLMTKTAREDPS
jgi:hypothetical protein